MRLKMKVTRLFALMFVLLISSVTSAQPLTKVFSNETLKNVLKEIENQTGLSVIYRNSDLNESKRITASFDDASLSEVMNAILDGNLQYSIQNNILVISRKETTPVTEVEKVQQGKTIKGKVTDATGEPIIGATLTVAGTTKGTATDYNGNYIIEGVSDSDVISVSFIGYISQELSATSPQLSNIVLQEDNKLLEEVVVTALGIKREEKSLGYAVQNVSGNSLQTIKGVDMTASLTGKVAGLVIKNSTEFNGTSGIEMRGESPLLVINGVPYGNMSLRDIPADEIENITTLKGATAAALYGARGSAGAIMITTKRGANKGLSIDVNSNTMFRAGWVAIPKAQTSYGHGLNGELADDYVWGPKLDIGNTALQWNPTTKQNEVMPLVSSGKNNFRNFLEPGLITNNSINVTQTGEN
ncbi:MAG TPA: carboxypeptidase-like regulatory domain-containing protein, partial [Petrimonas sp.]|nr:carboxypeptidase-like regulatory domain-containing protein [Petrimonas sp.]